MTTHATVAGSDEVRKAIPALADLAEQIGDPHVRHRGTIGGSIANNDPAADYPAACLGLGATIVTSKREVAADDFFEGMFETALEEDEIITAVRFPKPKRAAYMKFPNPASRYALVGVFVAETNDGVRVAVTGAGQDGVFRVAEMESALGSNFTPDALADIAVPQDDLNSDIHASAEYRAHLITVMAKRAVAAAAG
jgi:carbon-monoxide dehydrogenase medium subunit